MDFALLIKWTSPFPILGVSEVHVLNHFYFIFNRNFYYVNSVDPDQMPHSAMSDLGLHCLPRSQSWNARHERVKLQGYLSHIM